MPSNILHFTVERSVHSPLFVRSTQTRERQDRVGVVNDMSKLAPIMSVIFTAYRLPFKLAKIIKICYHLFVYFMRIHATQQRYVNSTPGIRCAFGTRREILSYA